MPRPETGEPSDVERDAFGFVLAKGTWARFLQVEMGNGEDDGKACLLVGGGGTSENLAGFGLEFGGGVREGKRVFGHLREKSIGPK